MIVVESVKYNETHTIISGRNGEEYTLSGGSIELLVDGTYARRSKTDVCDGFSCTTLDMTSFFTHLIASVRRSI
jgi:hypothetical protein